MLSLSKSIEQKMIHFAIKMVVTVVALGAACWLLSKLKLNGGGRSGTGRSGTGQAPAGEVGGEEARPATASVVTPRGTVTSPVLRRMVRVGEVEEEAPHVVTPRRVTPPVTPLPRNDASPGPGFLALGNASKVNKILGNAASASNTGGGSAIVDGTDYQSRGASARDTGCGSTINDVASEPFSITVSTVGGEEYTIEDVSDLTTGAELTELVKANIGFATIDHESPAYWQVFVGSDLIGPADTLAQKGITAELDSSLTLIREPVRAGTIAIVPHVRTDINGGLWHVNPGTRYHLTLKREFERFIFADENCSEGERVEFFAWPSFQRKFVKGSRNPDQISLNYIKVFDMESGMLKSVPITVSRYYYWHRFGDYWGVMYKPAFQGDPLLE